jgi:Acetoacetate decarboxylase (ADC)
VRTYAVMHAVPESVLPERVAAQLPAAAPSAPWSTRLHAVVWWHRATPAAPAAMPVPLRSRRRLGLTVAAFVRYTDTPVGGYHEILATPALLLEGPVPAATIPFIAVDSLASIVGGRANWALPKTHADFEWPVDGRLDLAARGDGWSVAAHLRARGPAFPFVAVARNRQVGPGGGELAMGIRGRGRARLGRATVAVAGPELPAWLREGRHPAVVITGARFHFAAPRAA